MKLNNVLKSSIFSSLNVTVQLPDIGEKIPYFKTHQPHLSFWKNLWSVQNLTDGKKDSFNMTGRVSTVKRLTLEESLDIFVLSGIKMGVLFALILLIFNSALIAQENSKSQQTKNAQPGTELILDEIQIEAMLEKPNVAILPNRERAEFGEFKFVDRSFLKEIRELPDEKVLFADKLYSVKKIKNYKKLINTIIGNNK